MSCQRSVSLTVIACFLISSLNLPVVFAQEGAALPAVLPQPGVRLAVSPPFNPPFLEGVKVYPENPFKFDFIFDQGDQELSDQIVREESNRLIKYFLASLTTPEKDLWVNLSPYEKDRIIPEAFGVTEMGRDLLVQDYLLKQLTASLIYPEDELGQKFWKRVYEEAQKEFGTTNVPVNTFNKVWIVPEKAVVYENAQAGTAYVVESRLKVMLEEDYLAQSRSDEDTVDQTNTNELGSQIVREIVIPELNKEVNEGTIFTQLRQVYHSHILATWYKKKIKDSILNQVYADQNKTVGVNINDPREKQKIYEQYVQAFKKGVYNYIKEERDPATQEMVARKYFSGGVQLGFSEDSSTNLDSSAVLEINSQPPSFTSAQLSKKRYEIRMSVKPAEGAESPRPTTNEAKYPPPNSKLLRLAQAHGEFYNQVIDAYLDPAVANPSQEITKLIDQLPDDVPERIKKSYRKGVRALKAGMKANASLYRRYKNSSHGIEELMTQVEQASDIKTEEWNAFLKKKQMVQDVLESYYDSFDSDQRDVLYFLSVAIIANGFNRGAKKIAEDLKQVLEFIKQYQIGPSDVQANRKAGVLIEIKPGVFMLEVEDPFFELLRDQKLFIFNGVAVCFMSSNSRDVGFMLLPRPKLAKSLQETKIFKDDSTSRHEFHHELHNYFFRKNVLRKINVNPNQTPEMFDAEFDAFKRFKDEIIAYALENRDLSSVSPYSLIYTRKKILFKKAKDYRDLIRAYTKIAELMGLSSSTLIYPIMTARNFEELARRLQQLIPLRHLNEKQQVRLLWEVYQSLAGKGHQKIMKELFVAQRINVANAEFFDFAVERALMKERDDHLGALLFRLYHLDRFADTIGVESPSRDSIFNEVLPRRLNLPAATIAFIRQLPESEWGWVPLDLSMEEFIRRYVSYWRINDKNQREIYRRVIHSSPETAVLFQKVVEEMISEQAMVYRIEMRSSADLDQQITERNQAMRDLAEPPAAVETADEVGRFDRLMLSTLTERYDDHIDIEIYKQIFNREVLNGNIKIQDGKVVELKAPNGKPSKLGLLHFLQVRDPDFIAWFGDWINHPELASKMIDAETGEPKIFYHGTGREFNEFDKNARRNFDFGERHAFYFSSDRDFVVNEFSYFRFKFLKSMLSLLKEKFNLTDTPAVFKKWNEFIENAENLDRVSFTKKPGIVVFDGKNLFVQSELADLFDGLAPNKINCHLIKINGEQLYVPNTVKKILMSAFLNVRKPLNVIERHPEYVNVTEFLGKAYDNLFFTGLRELQDEDAVMFGSRNIHIAVLEPEQIRMAKNPSIEILDEMAMRDLAEPSATVETADRLMLGQDIFQGILNETGDDVEKFAEILSVKLGEESLSMDEKVRLLNEGWLRFSGIQKPIPEHLGMIMVQYFRKFNMQELLQGKIVGRLINRLKELGTLEKDEIFLWEVFHQKYARDSNRPDYLLKHLELIKDHLARKAPGKLRVLDLGSGPEGRALVELRKELGDQVEGIGIDMDIDPKQSLPGVQLVNGDLRRLPFSNQSIDIINESFVMVYFISIKDFMVVLKEVMRVLENDGWFILFDSEYKDKEILSIILRNIGYSCDIEEGKEHTIYIQKLGEYTPTLDDKTELMELDIEERLTKQVAAINSSVDFIKMIKYLSTADAFALMREHFENHSNDLIGVGIEKIEAKYWVPLNEADFVEGKLYPDAVNRIEAKIREVQSNAEDSLQNQKPNGGGASDRLMLGEDAAPEMSDRPDQLGGIDFDPNKMNLKVNQNGEIQFHLDPALLKQLQDAPGFVPVIINVQPLYDLLAFLGIK